MKMYFSGIAGKAEMEMLVEAGVDRVLVDPVDERNLNGFSGHVALDSGAYRSFKSGKEVDIQGYINDSGSRSYDFRVMVDVIGDPWATMHNWKTHFKKVGGFIPVFQHGAPIEHLFTYLDDSEIVGLGGLVSLMRDKNTDMLSYLKWLCETYPGRFHVFGMNWLKAIEQLKEVAYSADTSKFLDGGRYGHVIFRNTRTGHLSQCPAKVLGLSLDRKQRIVECARNLKEFCA